MRFKVKLSHCMSSFLPQILYSDNNKSNLKINKSILHFLRRKSTECDKVLKERIRSGNSSISMRCTSMPPSLHYINKHLGILNHKNHQKITENDYQGSASPASPDPTSPFIDNTHKCPPHFFMLIISHWSIISMPFYSLRCQWRTL